MPGTDIITVITLASVSRRAIGVSNSVPIIKIINGVSYQILMVTGDRMGYREQSSPGRSIIIVKTVRRRCMTKIAQD